jgi:chromosome segregation ATPase
MDNQQIQQLRNDGLDSVADYIEKLKEEINSYQRVLRDEYEKREALDTQVAELEKERDELNKQCGEFQEGFFSYMAHCDHLQIEADNLKKKISNLTTPDESKKSGGDA